MRKPGTQAVSCGIFWRPFHGTPIAVHLTFTVGFKPHPLKGRMKGFWAVTVRANWRVIFRFAEGHAEDVDYVDYH